MKFDTPCGIVEMKNVKNAQVNWDAEWKCKKYEQIGEVQATLPRLCSEDNRGMNVKVREGVANKTRKYRSAPNVPEMTFSVSVRSVDGNEKCMTCNKWGLDEIKPKCVKSIIQCKSDTGVEVAHSHVYNAKGASDKEISEVNEPRLGPTTRILSRQVNLFDNFNRKPLTSRNEKLGATTTRSSPRLASAGAVYNNGAPTLLNSNNQISQS